MSTQQLQTSHPPIDELIELGTSSAYQYIGIFASRMCLILERFLDIEDYKVPTNRPLKEAIVFFEKAKHEATSGAPRKPTQIFSAPELISRFLLIAPSGETGVIQFCEDAISTLNQLGATNRRTSNQATRTVLNFFSFLEAVVRDVTPSFIDMSGEINPYGSLRR